jgi:predicted TIM-barrel fold metal-dependent hydrolase
MPASADPKGIRRLGPGDLAGRVIDIHAHLGLSMKAYALCEYPYCQSIEGLYYRQKASGVDLSVVFPFAPDLYFDLPTLVRKGRMVPARRPLGGAPYEGENRMVFAEVHRFCPEWSDRFLPFVSMDPGRAVKKQLAALRRLAAEYPIYGIKISPVLCQSPVTSLLEGGAALLDFAAELDLPLLLHAAVSPGERYSQVSDAFRVIERRPELRFCLAHCVGLSREFLERADAAPNVWVDTSALKIQVQAAHENQSFMAPPGERFDWDYSDHRVVMRELLSRFPKTIVWGSDSPAYTYIVRRLQGPGVWQDFRLKGTYEEEKAALDALPADLREAAGSRNAIAFLFGTGQR